jgi:hypothetical protein
MAITMTRVNGVYENDLAITMVFVANNDAVIYFGATNSDPGMANTIRKPYHHRCQYWFF